MATDRAIITIRACTWIVLSAPSWWGGLDYGSLEMIKFTAREISQGHTVWCEPPSNDGSFQECTRKYSDGEVIPGGTYIFPISSQIGTWSHPVDALKDQIP